MTKIVLGLVAVTIPTAALAATVAADCCKKDCCKDKAEQTPPAK